MTGTLHSPMRRRLLRFAAALIAGPTVAAVAATQALAKEEGHLMNPTSNYLPVRSEWLASGTEAALEPEMPIIDAHHHFYDRQGWTYLLDEYLHDAQSGHNITASVFMQGLTHYWQSGPEEMRPVGETEYVTGATAPTQTDRPQVAKGIVGYADLRRGAAVREVLEAHVQAGQDRFRGVRHLVT